MEETNQKSACKVLIVEDDPMIQQMYATMFGIRKFNFEVADDGVIGLQKAKEFMPDVILLDVMMPNMNGLEMLEKLKADPQLQSISVIMLSNLADEEDIQNAMRKGAIRYMIKSEYVPRQVANIVQEIYDSINTQS